MNISVPIENSLEFIEVTPVSPLISKCQIKVCYVQDEPNRNGSVITKETAKEMANTLPGCPIVGFYNESNEDFEGHNQSIKIGNGEVEVKDTTIPYGFVDMNPRVWFQQFADGPNHEIHEYLMTEGYIWSGQFPEAKRILTKGNNQSMELDDRFVDGKWAESEDGYYSFFIINDAVISKLCVLGEDVEPCFEGAQIKAQFSLDDFNQKFKTMAYELKQILGEGGREMEEIVQNEEMLQEEPVIEEEFANENEVVEEIVDTVVESTEDENFKKNDGQKEEKEDSQKADEDEEDYKKKRKCSLEDEEEVVPQATPQTQIESIKPRIDYSMSSLNSLLTKDKKIVTFIGTTKNGTSFLINNLAALFASLGINTAILDMTKNKNSYYIYTNNEEELRNIAYNSISKLQKGFAEGIKVNRNLTVYTALPNDGKDYSDAEPILSTLVQNHSLILIDCDFETDPSYFASCQEIYLVQSMDILTIQPLTAFVRD